MSKIGFLVHIINFRKKNLTIIDVNKLIILAADVGHVHVMGRGTDILVLFVGEDVQSDHVDLGVAVLAGLGGGHFHDFAGTTLFFGEKEESNDVLLQYYSCKKITKT